MTTRTLFALVLLVSFGLRVAETRPTPFPAVPAPRTVAAVAEARTADPHDHAAPAERAGQGKAKGTLVGVGLGALELCCAQAVSGLAGSVDPAWSPRR